MRNHKNELTTQLARAEVNFLVLPYFFLDRQSSTVRKIQYRDVRIIDGETYEVLWEVYPHPEFGIPRDFERRLHRAVEYIISQLQRPVRNPIRLGSYANIARIMDVPCTGKFIQQFKTGILKMIATIIVTKKAYYNKAKRVWMEEGFHLYDKAVFTGEIMDDGTVADTNYLYLSEPYLQNINASYVKPIDYDFLRSLRPIASRLYEILGVKFYGHSKFIKYRYSTLCKLLPLKRRKYLSAAKQQLNPAHEELVTKGFLKSYEWIHIPGVDDDWYIKYIPNQGYGEIIDTPSATESIPELTSEHGKDTFCSAEVRQLLELVPGPHRSKKTIEHIIAETCEKWGFDRVARNIKYTNKHCRNNYRAFLAKAIENDWGLELQEDEEARREALRKKDQEARRQEKEIQQLRRVRNYIQGLSENEKDELRRQAIARLGDELKGRDEASAKMLIRSEMEKIVLERYDLLCC